MTPFQYLDIATYKTNPTAAAQVQDITKYESLMFN